MSMAPDPGRGIWCQPYTVRCPCSEVRRLDSKMRDIVVPPRAAFGPSPGVATAQRPVSFIELSVSFDIGLFFKVM